MLEFKLDPKLVTERTVKVAVIGCGGNGSAFACGLPYLHQAMRAQGLQGLHTTLIDGDRISETNCVRQPFSRGEIGLPKSVVLASRLNQFWGLRWNAEDRFLGTGRSERMLYDLVVGCVDTRRARLDMHHLVTGKSSAVGFWLDIGNEADSGQFVLGQPWNSCNVRSAGRLRTAAELYPEIIDVKAEKPGDPSCSALEALTRQQPFVNQALASQALALLGRLFWQGVITYHGAFLNLTTGKATPLPIDPGQWRRLGKWNRRKRG